MLVLPAPAVGATKKESNMVLQMEHPPFGRPAKMEFLQALNKVNDQLEEARKAGDSDRIRALEEQGKVLEWQLDKACNPDPEAVAAARERAIRIPWPPSHPT